MMPNISTKTYFVGNESKTYFVGTELSPTTQSVRGIAPRTLLCNILLKFIQQYSLLRNIWYNHHPNYEQVQMSNSVNIGTITL